LRKFDVAYFTASCDTAETNKKFAESLKLDYPILSDPDRAVAQAYGLVKNKQGNAARWTFYIGADGKILHVDKKVNSGEAGKDVAAKLKELGVKEK
jgi:peroxiredoxin Q/BCP